ncbi:glycosyltransferase family 2 protein [Pasteurella multocida]|uniref:glycosyltransferase family 2 protein n=1 Tax=Pasteurella multocida TaxID=747 RepID=UPI00292E101B|nr:glycosyltransferase family 2 protein [Pasteurella multocida]
MISIILPTYNCSDYLDRSIMSVIRQSYSNWELLIIDDGSSDNTKEICNYYCSIDKRIKYFHHKNKGVSYSRNRGIQLSSGQYICFLDADDMYHPEFCKELLPQDNEKYDIVHAGFIYKKDSRIQKSITFPYSGNILEHYITCLSKQEHPFSICSILIRRDFILDNGIYFSKDKKNAEDTEFIIKLLLLANTKNIEKVLFTYFQDRKGSATSSTSVIEQIISILNMYKDIYLRYEIKPLVSNLIRSEIKFWAVRFLKKPHKNKKNIIILSKWFLKNLNIVKEK